MASTAPYLTEILRSVLYDHRFWKLWNGGGFLIPGTIVLGFACGEDFLALGFEFLEERGWSRLVLKTELLQYLKTSPDLPPVFTPCSCQRGREMTRWIAANVLRLQDEREDEKYGTKPHPLTREEWKDKESQRWNHAFSLLLSMPCGRKWEKKWRSGKLSRMRRSFAKIKRNDLE